MVLLVLIDQVSKFYSFLLVDQQNVSLNRFFDIISVENRGVSFGIFGKFSYANDVFIVVNTLFTLLLVSMLFYQKSFYDRFTISLMISGAIGNLIDRFIFGAVRDFLDFHAFGFHFPTFNFADSLLFLGVAMHFIRFLYIHIKRL